MAMDPNLASIYKQVTDAFTTNADAIVGSGNNANEADPYAGMNISRNAPCPCGSGLKYKQCHGKI